MNDNERGIYRKYEVTRLNDPSGKHEHCAFFVLDLVHDKFSTPALRAYAKACQKEFPQLAKEIRWALRTKAPRRGRDSVWRATHDPTTQLGAGGAESSEQAERASRKPVS